MRTSTIKKALLKKTKPKDETVVPSYRLLSTGSTLLNLACTGRYQGGFIKGKYHFLVGDSASGKTALAYTCMAEASINPHFDDYVLVHDDVEHGGMFNIRKLFGPKLAKRLITEHSQSLEEMYYKIEDYLEAGTPFIYVVDSMDSLVTEQDEDKFQEQKKAFAKGKKTTGSFGASKPKENSTNLRRLMTPLQKSGSIVIIISQTRDNLGFGFEKKTRSGGRALRFYATLEIWSSIKGKIKRSVKGKDRVIGITSKIDVKKNRVTGQERSIEVPIYYSIGFDDLGSCVDYLVTEGHWKKSAGKIDAPEFEWKGSADGLIKMIESDGTQKDLQKLVGSVWKSIEDQCKMERVNKYI